MNMLMRHVLRSVLVIRYRLLTIALICASTFGVLVGAYSAIDSLFDTVEDIQSNASMADLEVIFAPDDLINLPAFDDITGVTATHHRLLMRSEEHTSELQSLMRISYADFCLHKNNNTHK